MIGRQLPSFFLKERWLWQIRLDQLRRSPDVAPWLVRAVVLHPQATVVGHAGFHGPPTTRAWLRSGTPSPPSAAATATRMPPPRPGGGGDISSGREGRTRHNQARQRCLAGAHPPRSLGPCRRAMGRGRRTRARLRKGNPNRQLLTGRSNAWANQYTPPASSEVDQASRLRPQNAGPRQHHHIRRSDRTQIWSRTSISTRSKRSVVALGSPTSPAVRRR